MNRSLVAAVAAGVLLLSACSGPPDPLEVEMRKPYLDLTYGKQEGLAPLDRAPGSDIGPSTAPGLIAAPVGFDADVSARPAGPARVLAPDGTPAAPGAAACPKGDLYDPAVGEAPVVVTEKPLEGRFRFNRSGWLKTQAIAADPTYKQFATWPRQELSSEIVREVKNVRSVVASPGRPPTFEYQVVQTEPGPGNTALRTTTTYLIDPGTASGSEQDLGGVYIRQIITERADLAGQTPAESPVFTKGVETFNPNPPVKLMDLPVQPQAFDPDRESVGVDPLTGAQLKVIRQTARRERFDACGTVLDVWRVELFLTSEYVSSASHDSSRHPRGYRISGRFYFAPQLGGLIVHDDFLFGLDGQNDYKAVIPGRDGRNWFVQKSVASLRNIVPEPVG